MSPTTCPGSHQLGGVPKHPARCALPQCSALSLCLNRCSIQFLAVRHACQPVNDITWYCTTFDDILWELAPKINPSGRPFRSFRNFSVGPIFGNHRMWIEIGGNPKPPHNLLVAKLLQPTISSVSGNYVYFNSIFVVKKIERNRNILETKLLNIGFGEVSGGL